MATIVTISTGDFARVTRAISIAVGDAADDKQYQHGSPDYKKLRDALAARQAKRVLDTLGIKVADQTPFST